MHYMPPQKFVMMSLMILLYTHIVHTAGCTEQKQHDRALMQALKTAHVPDVACLLNNGANPNYKRSLSGQTALMVALSARVPCERIFDIVIVVRMLVERGADVKAIKTTHDGITALHCVATRTDISNVVCLQLIKILLDAGADRDAKARSICMQQNPEMNKWRTVGHYIADRKSFWYYRYPELSQRFAWREEFLRRYNVNTSIAHLCDHWLPDAMVVAHMEKSAYMLRVDHAQYRKTLAASSGCAHKRPDLFKDGW